MFDDLRPDPNLHRSMKRHLTALSRAELVPEAALQKGKGGEDP